MGNKGGSLGAPKVKSVVGKGGIRSGGADVPNAKPIQDKNVNGGYAPFAKTNVPTTGGKGTGGKL